MIKAVAIDDEPLALKVIEHFCEQTENIVLEKAFTKTEEGIKYLRKFPVDLLFLDIQMPGKNGIDFYKSLSTDVMVIFTTAYSEYAVEGFNLNATDYLLKPISYERFITAVEKVQKEKSLRIADPENKYLMIRADYKLHRIEYDNILLIEGLDDYIRIHLKDKNAIVTRLSMKGILEKLPSTAFIRVHRSYIVPVGKIKTVQNKTITIEEFVIPVGDVFKEELNKHL
ncbi:response regulator transcription factor [Flavobacterium salilacus subsp. salilacus]|uniref:LytR/AlgR family response regulator transcription factor n=1 Tax=Flavobacterium TaxID=237 RepID=UPI0010756A8B|nr:MULTISPECIES: LytTR family DNA-binding domain-containing protein [Flavobacterium]KAF2520084.1 response regulator transcription factor [Flavobacterium salilacus subsp. salilacus]MBE1614000.1 response regulator transcription factor [Flavobacterium sp. SaA2.13]